MKFRALIKAAGRIVSIMAISLLALGLGPTVITFGSYLYYEMSGTIMPDVSIGGVPVGGLTREEAQARLDRVWNKELRLAAVDLHNPSRAWVVSPAEFGLKVDPILTAQRALTFAREGRLLDQINLMLAVLRTGIDLPPIVDFDVELAELRYASWDQQLRIPPQDGWLILERGEVIVHPAVLGWEIDVPGSVALLAEDPLSYLTQQQVIPIAMRSFEPEITDLSETVSRLEDVLGSHPQLQAYDPVTDKHFTWEPDRVMIASWIKLQLGGGGYSFELDQQAIDDFILDAVLGLGTERALDMEGGRDQLIAQISGLSPEPLIISYLPTEYIVQPGDQWISLSFKVGIPYWKLQEANPVLVRQGLIPGETLILPPRDGMLTLPVVPEKRIVIDISEQRMWVYQDQGLIHEYVISTGIPDSPTLPGVFQVSSHYENAYASIWDLYMPHFIGIYDAVPGLTNGIHGLPLLSNGRRLWADVLGRPASFGCIILDLVAAEELFTWAEDGVVVVIQA